MGASGYRRPSAQQQGPAHRHTGQCGAALAHADCSPTLSIGMRAQVWSLFHTTPPPRPWPLSQPSVAQSLCDSTPSAPAQQVAEPDAGVLVAFGTLVATYHHPLGCQTLTLKRHETLRELKHSRMRFEAMRAELQAMRDAQRASVVCVAGWQPRAVQRRFDQEVAIEPLPAEARVRQITQELEDVRQHIRTLSGRVVSLEHSLQQVQQAHAKVNEQHDQMHALMESTLRLLEKHTTNTTLK